MNFYAYLPDKDGNEPLGTDNRVISRDDYKSLRTFIQYGLKWRDPNQKWKIFTFTNFYDQSTFKQLR